MSPQRRYLSLQLAPSSAPEDAHARNPGPEDVNELAALMLCAYRGTIDDEGESLEDARGEVERYLGGEYGTPLLSCSEVATRCGEPVSATLVSLWEEAPLLTFSMTHPDWKRQGLAKAGLQRCIQRLWKNDYTELRLLVTKGNHPAERLYEGMGFRDIEPDS